MLSIHFQIEKHYHKSNDISKRPEMDYFMNEFLGDVVFVVENQKLPALKLILSFKSKVFRAMFAGNVKEINNEGIPIKDTTFVAFKAFIQFLYCDQLVLKNINDLELIEEVCKLSVRFDTTPLTHRIGEHLKTIEITSSNMELMSRMAFICKVDDIKTKVKAFIDNNFGQYVYRDIKDLLHLNDSTNSLLLKVLANNYHKLSLELTELKNQINSTKDVSLVILRKPLVSDNDSNIRIV